MTRKNQFELVTASMNNQEELDLDSHSYFQWQVKTGLSLSQPITASFNNQEEPVLASHSQFQWQGKTSLR